MKSQSSANIFPPCLSRFVPRRCERNDLEDAFGTDVFEVGGREEAEGEGIICGGQEGGKRESTEGECVWKKGERMMWRKKDRHTERDNVDGVEKGIDDTSAYKKQNWRGFVD